MKRESDISTCQDVLRREHCDQIVGEAGQAGHTESWGKVNQELFWKIFNGKYRYDTNTLCVSGYPSINCQFMA